MKGILFVAALLLCAVSVAQAGLTARVGPGEDAGNGLMRYIVYIDADSPDYAYVCGAMEGSLLGPMNQVWVNGVTPTGEMSTAVNLSPADLAVDTHVVYNTDILSPDVQALGAWKPREDGPGTGSFMRGEDWITGELQDIMAIGFLNEIRQQYLPVFQVVIPAGETVLYSGRAANSEGTAFPTGLESKDDFAAYLAAEELVWWPVQAVVPEPCTIGLLLAGVGMIVSRRRR